jgi:tripartite-type tricarboxylate transporter receptor subunit TctC
MIAGQLDYAVVDIASALPQVRSGKLRALAVTASREVVQMPGVPPMSATLPDFQLLGWYALYGPACRPAGIAGTLGSTVLAGLADPAVQKRLEGANLSVFPADGETLRRFMASEEQVWRRHVREAGVEVQ